MNKTEGPLCQMDKCLYQHYRGTDWIPFFFDIPFLGYVKPSFEIIAHCFGNICIIIFVAFYTEIMVYSQMFIKGGKMYSYKYII